MLFLIFVGILVIGIVALVLYNTSFDCGCTAVIGSFLTVIGFIALVVSLFVIGGNYIDQDGYIAKMNTRYESLAYQYENDIYDNDNDLGKRELMVNIQAWNEDLACYRERQDDLWIGIYIPNIYDQFEFIELDRGNG